MSDTSEPARAALTVTSVPSDLALRISSRPPCSCTSALAIGRPSPVPSRQRERLASTWPNGRQRHRDLFAGHAEPGVAHAHGGAAACASARLDGHRAAGRGELDGVADGAAGATGGVAGTRRLLAFDDDIAVTGERAARLRGIRRASRPTQCRRRASDEAADVPPSPSSARASQNASPARPSPSGRANCPRTVCKPADVERSAASEAPQPRRRGSR